MDRRQNEVPYRHLLRQGCLESSRRMFSFRVYVEKYLRLVSTLASGRPSGLRSDGATGAPADHPAIAETEAP